MLQNVGGQSLPQPPFRPLVALVKGDEFLKKTAQEAG
jgi:hypothetical protein